MKRDHLRGIWSLLAVAACLIGAPSARATVWVIDAVYGDDTNGGASATGGAGDLSALDFNDAFKTIGAAVAVAVDGDTICVGPGLYSEELTLSVPNLSLLAVGEAVLGNVPGSAIFLTREADNTTIDGFTIQNCGYAGINTAYAAGGPVPIYLTNLNIQQCLYGIWHGNGTAIIKRCLVRDCSGAGYRGYAQGAVATISQCTFARNEEGIYLPAGGTGIEIRNNIIVDNAVAGIKINGTPAIIDFNNVWNNGPDPANDNYVDLAAPGPNDLSQDPQFVDLGGVTGPIYNIFHLDAASAMINAGFDPSTGGPVTIGAREVGDVSAFYAQNGFIGWLEADTRNAILSCPDPGAGDVCINDGAGNPGELVLNAGVTGTRSILSPVYQGSLKSLRFGASEDLTLAPGARRAIDGDPGTSKRELYYRGSDSSFTADAPDAAPGNPFEWRTIFEGQELDTNFQWIQAKLTLTTEF